MNKINIPELETKMVFMARPESIPGDMRPLWRIGILLLILDIASRGGKSSFGRLHMLNWALRTRRNYELLTQLTSKEAKPGSIVVRVEPSLNRAVDFAHGEGLLEHVAGDRICLTQRGKDEAKKLRNEDEIFVEEKEFLNQLGNKLTEKLVKEIYSARL